MEYWTNEEIRSGYKNELIDELKQIQKGIKNSESSIQKEPYIYEKSSMDFPEGYVRYTCVPQISYRINSDIKTTNKQEEIIIKEKMI